MSMSVLSILQCLMAFLTYLFMTVIVPSAVFGRRFRHLDINQRFMAYFTIGNFYMINIVFVLQLLRISNRITLILATLIPAVIMYSHNNRISLRKKAVDMWDEFNHLIMGHLGIKTALGKVGSVVSKKLVYLLKKFREIFIDNFIQWILLAVITVFFLKIFGTNMVTNFGYTASDVPVHNYWINYLNQNEIFVAGIYPFGFHCVIYYLHEVFGLDTYVLLRVFCVVQTFFIHLMILSLLKYCCKTKYTPYIGMAIYVIANIFGINTYHRFYATLPQEFGMLFIYPSAYFAFAFFNERKKEIKLETDLYGNSKEQRRRRKQKLPYRLKVKECFSTWFLAGFAMSFSMTLAVHFYGTMVAGLFCVGIAAGFLFRFIRKKYFYRVICTFMISVFVAVLPMGIAFAQGTPLQGSLGWGMNVLTGASDDDDEDEKDKEDKEGQTVNRSEEGQTVSVSSVQVEDVQTPQGNTGNEPVSTEAVNASSDGVQVSAEAINVSSDSVQVSTEAVDASSNSVQVSDDSAQTSYGGIGIEETEEEDEEKDEFKLKAVVNTYDDNGIIAPVCGVQRFYDTDELQYKRSISFYVDLYKKSPERFVDKIEYVIKLTCRKIIMATGEYVFPEFAQRQIVLFYIIAIIMFVVGILLFVFKHYDYGAIIVSITVFMLCMALLLAAGKIGLPTLMDASRCSIYYSYMLPLLMALVADVIIYTLFGWLKWKWVKWIMHFVSLVCFVAVVGFIVENNMVKEPYYPVCFESNEAVTCLTNIIKEEKDYTWTICSANDETQMGYDHGYHYEIIEFLRRMECMGGNAMLTIPTEAVYFFIEKVPIDYPDSYEDSGQKISREGALNYLPAGGGLAPYQKRARWIVMSRMYYWAEEFNRMYPNEMKVYFETEDFVCYKVTQNTYRLYNFAIDYGYNTDIYEFSGREAEISNDDAE